MTSEKFPKISQEIGPEDDTRPAPLSSRTASVEKTPHREGLRIPEAAKNADYEPPTWERATAPAGVSAFVPWVDDVEDDPLMWREATRDEDQLLARGLSDQVLVDWQPPQGELDDADAQRADVAARARLLEGDVDKTRALLDGRDDDTRLAAAQAMRALADNDVDTARERIDSALSLEPDGIVERYCHGLVEMAENKIESAQRTLGEVAKSYDDHALARYQLGVLEQAMGDAARAGTLFEMALEISPTFLSPGLSLGELLLDARQYGEVMVVVDDLVERRPEALAPRLLQLRLLIEVGELDAAEQLSEVLREAANDHVEVLRMWADVKAQRGHHEQARKALDEALSSAHGDGRARVLQLRAQIEIGHPAGNFDDVVDLLEEAARSASMPDDILHELASLSFNRQRHADGRRALEMMLKSARTLRGLLSATVLAQTYGERELAVELAKASVARAEGTPAAGQIEGLLGHLLNA